MISKFFLHRPVFATTISLFITLVGLISLKYLPLEQYPQMSPPMVLVSASYPGASAQMIADTVAAPLEERLNGVGGMIYMESQNSVPGNMSLKIYFAQGTDPDKALYNVQDVVNLGLSSLPDMVRQQGVTVSKSSDGVLLFIAIQADEELYDEMFISNYATLHVADALQRIDGVSDASVINSRDYSMRIWLKPDRLAQFSLTTTDVLNAIKIQNAMHAVGQIGQEPSTSDMMLTIPVYSMGRLTDPKEFEKIILKATPDGALVYLGDVGRAELGSQNYDMEGTLDGKFFAAIKVSQDPSANALQVASNVKAKMESLSKLFPSGLKYSIPYDTTKFVKVSIKDVEWTLIQSAILVSLVILIFLQSFTATLIPVIAMIVSIVGTFGGMYVLGFSVNTLTLFGMILAVGIVVDDAIVVVENIEHNMRDLGMDSKTAAIKTMNEVTGPVVAIVLVLCAVFIPVAFIGGLAGALYRQFAITIAVSAVISGFVALTLSPVLAMRLLKNQKQRSHKAVIWFNNGFTKITNGYIAGARWLMGRPILGMGIFVLLILSIWVLHKTIPAGFIPTEDQGYVMISASLPDGANLKRVEKVTEKIQGIVDQSPAVDHFIALAGYSLLDGTERTKNGAYYITLKDWSQRRAKELSATSLVNTFNAELSTIPEASIFTFNPSGIGVANGVEFWILNQEGASLETFEKVVADFMAKIKLRPEVSKGSVSSTLEPDGMQLFLDVDVAKAKIYQVNLDDIFDSLQVLLSSVYVNDFNKFGRVFEVVAQAEPSYRSTIEDIGRIYVKGANDAMIPLKSLIMTRFVKGQTLLTRFNGFPAAKIMVVPNSDQGYGAGEAMEALEELAHELLLPYGMSFAYSGQAYQQQAAGGASGASLFAGIVMIFLVLAALYERWTLPIAILLAVPFGIFGAFFAVWIRHMPNDIYFQIGLIALVALSAKNAILIVEFARHKRQAGMGIVESATEAARLRFRAIIMTSLTFILGVLPLLLSRGAGSASRHSVGTGVMGGMFFATFFALFFIPLFFRIIESIRDKENEK